MNKFAILVVLVVALALVSVCEGQNNKAAAKRCRRTPSWLLNQRRFPHDFYGRVKIVALLKASCPFCRQQAKDLAKIKAELAAEGMSDIDFMIINHYERENIEQVDVFKAIKSVDLFQDFEKANVWGRYKGLTDDMIIMDECNRITYHYSMPESLIYHGHVKAALIDTYNNQICGPCRISKSRQG